MENVTHTLLGVALGRVIGGSRPPAERKAFANAVLLTSVLANNAPDLDVFIPPLLGSGSGGQLAYLLQHRGYTHTAIAAPFLAVLCAFIACQVFRKDLFRRGFGLRDWLILFGTGIAGVLLHLFADSWNDYGVHPFWPFSSRWYFGGTVFIVEPLLWFALIPFAFDTLRSWLYRGVFGLLWLAMMGMVWVRNLVPWQVSFFLTLVAIGMIYVQRRFRGRSFAAWTAVCVVFAVNSLLWNVAYSRIRAQLARERPLERVTDVALTPAPSNPSCWRVITASLDPGTPKSGPEYRARVGTLSLLPEVFDPAGCFLGAQMSQNRTMPGSPLSLAGGFDIRWTAEYRENLGKLRRIGDANCRLGAFFHWSRFPFLAKFGDEILAGDIRYDREKGAGFALIGLDPKLGCPSSVPGWEEPFWRRVAEVRAPGT